MSVPGLQDQNGVEFLSFAAKRSIWHEDWRELHAVVDRSIHVKLQVPDFWVRERFHGDDSRLSETLAKEARVYAEEANQVKESA